MSDNDVSVTKFLKQAEDDIAVTKYLASNDITVTKFLDEIQGDLSAAKFLAQTNGDSAVSKYLQQAMDDMPRGLRAATESERLAALGFQEESRLLRTVRSSVQRAGRDAHGQQ